MIGLSINVILSYFLGYIAGQHAEKVTNKLKPSKGNLQNERNEAWQFYIVTNFHRIHRRICC
ncbi:hypothetical protein JXA56_00380 [Candidatus Micrarchaeota archaeon]|nr:hypothetical protein [Candidatus Micrarchaeota archaeon]